MEVITNRAFAVNECSRFKKCVIVTLKNRVTVAILVPYLCVLEMRSIIITFLLTTSLAAFGQDAHDRLVVVQGDLVKTDNVTPFRKAQFGGEFHYFATSSIAANAGFEVWTDDEVSFSVGARWYPVNHAFVRVKGLIGENDLVIGGGWVVPLGNGFHFEASGDFYFKVDFSIRAGIAYIIRRD